MLNALLSIVFCSGAFAQEHEYSFMDEYKAPTSKEFALSTSDGFIQVQPGTENNVKVYYIVKKGNHFVKINRSELEEKVELDISTSGGKLDIAIRNKDKYRMSNWKEQYSVSCEVYVPKDTYCYIKTSDGDVEIEGLEANQRCKTSDGEVRLSKITGDVDAKTSDGDVMVKFIKGNIMLTTSDGDVTALEIDGDATLETSDGDVEFEKVTGKIDASTSDGDITFTDCSGSLFAETSDGTIKGNLLKVNGNLTMKTSDGNIHLTVPRNTGMDIKMKGEDLNIPKVELSGRIDEHHIEGQLFGGGQRVEMITSDGSVTLSLK